MKFYSLPIFKYPIQTYSFEFSKEVLSERLTDIFQRNTIVNNDNQYSGYMSSKDSFEIKFSHIALVIGFIGNTKLLGSISSEKQEKSTIQINIKPAIGYYVWFTLGIIIGIVYIFQFIDSRNLNYLFASAFSLIIVPFLFVQIFKVIANSLIESFEKQIDQSIRQNLQKGNFV